jgi:taurine--2-oxoglutarate transaminase
VIISRRIAETFAERPYPGGLTYSGHPLACAAAVASIGIFKEEGLVENARRLGEDVFGPELRGLQERHPSIGDVRGLGCFWALELVKDRQTREMLVPYNAGGESAKPMSELTAACKDRGLWPFVHFNRVHVVPPIVITPQEAKQGIAILDEALEVADRYITA